MKKNTILKIIGAFLLFIVMGLEGGFAQLGKVHGTVKGNDGLPAVGATVTLKRDGAPIGGYITRADGKYEIANVNPGSYMLEVYDGKRTVEYSVTISPGESDRTHVDMALAYQGDDGTGYVTNTDTVRISAYRDGKKIFDVDPIDPFTLTGAELRQMPTTRNLNDMVAMAPKTVQKDHGDPLNMGGSRESATTMYMDGVKLRGSNQIPMAAIDQMSVIDGGIPAEFGDATGAVIVVTSYNPGMKGYFGPEHPNKVRRAIRKKHKEMNEKGDEGFIPPSNGFFSMNHTITNRTY